MKAKDHPAYKPELTLAAKLDADKAKLKAFYDKRKVSPENRNPKGK